MKCYYSSGTRQAITGKLEAKDWKPTIDSDDGESLFKWTHTSNAQVIPLKDAHKNLPVDVSGLSLTSAC